MGLEPLTSRALNVSVRGEWLSRREGEEGKDNSSTQAKADKACFHMGSPRANQEVPTDLP